jgi:DNA invertase Pin-like site-specific DNA recombinase
LLLSVLGAFAEFARALIRERQLEGITLAKARGAYTGSSLICDIPRPGISPATGQRS